MIADNPQAIKKAEIIVGIPSYNEVDNIAFVTEQVSQGLKKYFPDKSSLIINADNNSTDGTKEVFLRFKSSVPKVYLSTRAGVKGKGNNFYTLFNFIKERSSKINIVVDADLKSIKPDWIKKMARPITEGYDFVVPVYSRNKRDGLVTTNLCHPLIYGLLGWKISQPIGGDFAFSLDMAKHWLSKKWPSNVYQFGIDIFMTTEAILNNFKIAGVNLNRKVHRVTRLTLKSMFVQVADTLFSQLVSYKRFWQNEEIIRPKLFYKNSLPKPQPFRADPQRFQDVFHLGFLANEKFIKKVLSRDTYDWLKKIHETEKNKIGSDLWSKIVYDFLHAYENSSNKKKLIETMELLAFGRFFAFLKESENLNFKQAKEKVFNQAKVFRKNRDYLLK